MALLLVVLAFRLLTASNASPPEYNTVYNFEPKSFDFSRSLYHQEFPMIEHFKKINFNLDHPSQEDDFMEYQRRKTIYPSKFYKHLTNIRKNSCQNGRLSEKYNRYEYLATMWSKFNAMLEKQRHQQEPPEFWDFGEIVDVFGLTYPRKFLRDLSPTRPSTYYGENQENSRRTFQVILPVIDEAIKFIDRDLGLGITGTWKSEKEAELKSLKKKLLSTSLLKDDQEYLHDLQTHQIMDSANTLSAYSLENHSILDSRDSKLTYDDMIKKLQLEEFLKRNRIINNLSQLDDELILQEEKRTQSGLRYKAGNPMGTQTRIRVKFG